MTSELTIDIASANDLWRRVIGSYVWAVRIGEDRTLRMEFGEPHLTIREPIQSGSGSQRVITILSRRQVMPTGRWSLFVEDGLWSVETSRLRCTRDGRNSAAENECLDNLSGQRVVSVAVGGAPAELTVKFDLSGVLRVEFCTEFAGNSQWMLFLRNGDIISHENDGSFIVEKDDCGTEDQDTLVDVGRERVAPG